MSNDLTIQPQGQVETEEAIRLRSKLLPPYKVILFNDDAGSRAHHVNCPSHG